MCGGVMRMCILGEALRTNDAREGGGRGGSKERR